VQDGAVLDLSQLPPNLTMRADTDPPVVGSVSIRIDGGQPRPDNMAPYSVSTDVAGNFTPWMLALGAHTVTATPFDAADGGGRQGEPLEIDFTLSRSTAGPDMTMAPVGVPPDGGVAGVGARAGAAGNLPMAGNGVSINPQLGALDAGVLTVSRRGATDEAGCGCRVPGEAGAGSAGTPRAWVLATLALGLFVQRRRTRLRGRAPRGGRDR
jgi:MYXO-CTERM domain-containing protein